MNQRARRVIRSVTPAPARRRLRRWFGGDGATARPIAASDIDRIYTEAQSLASADTPATDDELRELADAWQDEDIPAAQRRIVDVQLANLAQGKVDPVFTALATGLQFVDLPRFSILDAACASGYYSEVIRVLDPRPIAYEGYDYSPAMIESARVHQPGVPFSVEDLTALTTADDTFDVVLLAGVLEHIPDYPAALAESARVAREYLIVHRCPTVAGPKHLRTIGTQYNVRTPRTFFSTALLASEIAAVGFEPVATIDVYPTASSASKSGAVAVDERGAIRSDRTLTLVFRRRRVASIATATVPGPV